MITIRWRVVKGLGGWGVWAAMSQDGRPDRRLCVHRTTNGADAHRWACDRADQYRRLISWSRVDWP